MSEPPQYFGSRAQAVAAAPSDRPHIVVNVAAVPRRTIPQVQVLLTRGLMDNR